MCDQALTGYSRTPVCHQCLSGAAHNQVRFHCETCGQPFETEPPPRANRLCGPCLISPPAFDKARSFGIYEDGLRRLIHLFKYDKMRPLAKPLASHMASALPQLGSVDLCLPVPLYRSRRWKRGFNQSELLAAEVCRISGIRLGRGILRRVKATESQAGLSNRARLANVAGAFAVPRPEAVKGRRVLVIDDVMTTGATLAACAKALKKAGAASVVALTVARAKRRIIDVRVPRAAGNLSNGNAVGGSDG